LGPGEGSELDTDVPVPYQGITHAVPELLRDAIRPGKAFDLELPLSEVADAYQDDGIAVNPRGSQDRSVFLYSPSPTGSDDVPKKPRFCAK
jgi:hypothetical protein